MKSKAQKTAQRHVFLRTYYPLWQLEEAITIARNNNTHGLQISVLGKLGQKCMPEDKKMISSKKGLKTYWKGSLGATSDFGLFSNPEIGTIFIAGPLVSIFLRDIDGKALGAMSTGPSGILRGLGIPEDETVAHIKNLNEGAYLLIIRGYGYPLDMWKHLFEKIG